MEESKFLVHIDQAKKEIQSADSLLKVKDLWNKADAVRQLGKASKDPELINYATEFKLRCERRLGELLFEMKEKGNLDKGGGDTSTGHRVVTSANKKLIELGVSKNMSSRSQQIAKVPEEKFESIIGKMKDQEIEISRKAVNKLLIESEKVVQKENKLIKQIKGKYEVIVIDPPWPIQKIMREVAPNQSLMDYPTMTIEEIKEFGIRDLLSPNGSHVWLWTTHKFLPLSFEIIEYWGLRYICTFVWHKPGGFQPFGLPQYNCEFALYARKGNPEFYSLKDFNLCFSATRGRHTEKPEEFYNLIRRVTKGKRIDIFNRREIDGFDSWGNE